MNFARKQGMIITLNNTEHFYAGFARFFDCSWISQFPDEDERVFAGLYIYSKFSEHIYQLYLKYIGGLMTIRVETVRIVKTN